ncbi:MAG TPA: hypothetical protein VIL85_25805 [Thermomicrobiales bacterium]|jgi:hypothetical protein
MVLIALAAPLIVWVLQAFALPISEAIVRRWIWLYTRGMTPDSQSKKASDAEAHYKDLKQAWIKDDGSKAEHIALRLLADVVRGMRDDIAWRWETDLAEQFARRLRSLRIRLHLVDPVLVRKRGLQVTGPVVIAIGLGWAITSVAAPVMSFAAAFGEEAKGISTRLLLLASARILSSVLLLLAVGRLFAVGKRGAALPPVSVAERGTSWEQGET